MVLRLIMFCTLLFCVARLAAQNDTTMLRELTIHGSADNKFLAGSGIYALDSSLKEVNSSRHLGEILSFQFPIHFRNYGSGMLSSISMRGTSSQHTAVLWNGININSFSLGQADFSMLPSTAFDSIQVHAGGGSARFGSGAFGGTILLSSGNSKKKFLSYTQELASFNRYFSSLAIGFHKDRISYSSSFYHLKSENDFPIIGTDERQQQAAYLQRGTTQNVKYQLTARESIGVHYWYHYADRELQPTLGTVNSRDEQQDENHRLLIDYERKKLLNVLQLKAGVIDDDIIYNGGKSNVRRWVFGANQQFSFYKKWNLEWSGNANHIIGNIKEYASGQAKENRYEIAISARRDFKKLSIAANIRQPFISHVSAPLLLYVGGDFWLFEKNNKSIQAKANVSRNFRAPTLNDRYWGNAGDKNLLPEVSHGVETGFVFQSSKWKIETIGFYQLVDQWIQWKPTGENGRFVPRNITQVEVLGVETSVSAQHKINKGLIQVRLSYQSIRSVITKAPETEERTLGKQLIYTPKNIASTFISLRYIFWHVTIALQGTSTRFTDDLNAKRYTLDPYVLADFSCGRFVTLASHRLSAYVCIKNLLNSNYQLYVARAQPGRNFSLQINYQINSKL